MESGLVGSVVHVRSGAERGHIVAVGTTEDGWSVLVLTQAGDLIALAPHELSVGGPSLPDRRRPEEARVARETLHELRTHNGIVRFMTMPSTGDLRVEVDGAGAARRYRVWGRGAGFGPQGEWRLLLNLQGEAELIGLAAALAAIAPADGMEVGLKVET